MPHDDTTPMDIDLVNTVLSGREFAWSMRTRYGLRWCQSLVWSVSLGKGKYATIAETAPEFWRGFRNEVAALGALASRKAPTI